MALGIWVVYTADGKDIAAIFSNYDSAKGLVQREGGIIVEDEVYETLQERDKLQLF